MTSHARLSPSAAESWMTCYGYPNAIEGLPNDSNEFAAEGTAAHTVSELCLEFGLSPFDFVGMKQKIEQWEFEWDEDDAEYMIPGIEEVRQFDGKFFGEHKVDLSNWLGPNQFGTLDRGIITDDLIIINDLKWGRGIPVTPVENKQLRLYALGFWHNIARHETKATDILIMIDQPRCDGGGGQWRTTLDDLLAFGEEAKHAAEQTMRPDAPRTASAKGCLWCPRRIIGCQTYDEFQMELIGMSFDEIDEYVMLDEPPPVTRLITPDRRSYILRHRKMLEDWLENLHVDCIDDALVGNPTPGYKVVEGRRPRRKWISDTEAEDVFVPLVGWNQKLKTPAQVEKEIGKSVLARFTGMVNSGDPKPILVPDADARSALTPITDKFDEVEI